MDRRKHTRRPHRLQMAAAGFCILSGAAVAGACLLFSCITFPAEFVDSLALLALSIVVFGMAIPATHALLLLFCCRQYLGTEPAWMRSAFLTIHWAVFVPVVAFLVAPALVAVWPSMRAGDLNQQFYWCVVFAVWAAIPAPLYLFLRAHWQRLFWPLFARPRESAAPPPPEIRIRRRMPTVPKRRRRSRRSFGPASRFLWA